MPTPGKDPLTHPPASKTAGYVASPAHLLLATAVSIFLEEAFVMYLISVLPSLSGYAQGIADASLLLAFVFPTLYFFIYRPMKLHINERKKAEEEKEAVIEKLQKALVEIKTLQGIIPICASCKKIRDDKGFWQRVEIYIRDHTSAEFSHGLCPGCAKELYPEFP